MGGKEEENADSTKDGDVSSIQRATGYYNGFDEQDGRSEIVLGPIASKKKVRPEQLSELVERSVCGKYFSAKGKRIWAAQILLYFIGLLTLLCSA